MYLQMTSRNVIVTYKTVSDEVLANSQVLQGFADDDWMSFNTEDNVEVKKSLDNTTIGWVKPIIVKGKLRVLPNSTAQQILQSVQTFQTQTGILAPGTLSLAYPALLGNITYNNFTITNPFSGWPLGERVGNIDINFAAEVPFTAAINAALQLGLASIGAFA